jgi:holliday junction DNA helicase RuvA
MIGSLRGQLLRKAPQEVLVEVGGVGYRVHVPVSTFYRLGEAGAEVRLFVHTHVREDSLALFGFATEAEQALFERLIGVAGVGPRVALSILSGIEADELLAALRHSDLARLTRIPGVGRKTAERLVVELKDKVAALQPAGAPAAWESGAGLKTDLVSALCNLGYSRPDAEKAAERAVRQDGEGRFEDLLRRTLQDLSRS